MYQKTTKAMKSGTGTAGQNSNRSGMETLKSTVKSILNSYNICGCTQRLYTNLLLNVRLKDMSFKLWNLKPLISGVYRPSIYQYILSEKKVKMSRISQEEVCTCRNNRTLDILLGPHAHAFRHVSHFKDFFRSKLLNIF